MRRREEACAKGDRRRKTKRNEMRDEVIKRNEEMDNEFLTDLFFLKDGQYDSIWCEYN